MVVKRPFQKVVSFLTEQTLLTPEKLCLSPQLRFMSRSSHIQSVLIVVNMEIDVELWMFIYFLLFGWGKFNQN